MKKYIDINKGFTHSGKFHTDDVFSTALLKILNPEFTTERGFAVPEEFDGIVYDIGLGKFDHHQQERRVRENGVPYAAFGLLWEEYGSLLVGEEEAVRFDEKFIQPLDQNDNLGTPNSIAEVISVFNPPWDYVVSSDVAFFEAVDMAYLILKKEIEHIKSIGRAKDVVMKGIHHAENGIMYLSRSAPWKKFVKDAETDIQFVVFPSSRGGYCAQAVPDEENPDQLKIPFPEQWRGREAEELPSISGVETLKFCHNSGFLLSTHTKEDAIKACELAKALAES